MEKKNSVKPKVTTKVKPKSTDSKVKSTLPKAKPKSTESKAKPKLEPKEPKKKKSITVQYNEPKDTDIDENKYSQKIKKLLFKIKNQNTDIDNRIRFCWKN